MPNPPNDGYYEAYWPRGARQQRIRALAPRLKSLEGKAVAQLWDFLFKGGFKEVNCHFYEHEYSDGLPIVPPTREDIEAFLRFTDRGANQVLGTVLPDKRAATIWSIDVTAGRIPKVFYESDDPNRFVPIVWETEDYMIAVSRAKAQAEASRKGR